MLLFTQIAFFFPPDGNYLERNPAVRRETNNLWNEYRTAWEEQTQRAYAI